jgi:large subunit ribosomal protein L27Ae
VYAYNVPYPLCHSSLVPSPFLFSIIPFHIHVHLLKVAPAFSLSATAMPSRLRKIRKLQGHRSHSHGHGRMGKHRKHPEGRGNAGGRHHRRVNFDKYHPGYFGEVGMRHYHSKSNQSFCPTVNLDELWTLVNEQRGSIQQKNKTGAAPITNVV